MMGRLLSPEQSERSRRSEDARPFQPLPEQPFMNTNIPRQQVAPIPDTSPFGPRADALNPRSLSSLTDMPPLQERSSSSFQKSLSTQSDITQSRTSAVSPTLKLPPILGAKASSAPEVGPAFATSSQKVAPPDKTAKCPSLTDMKMAYENMMVSYFMAQSTEPEGFSQPGYISTGHLETSTGFVPASLPPISQVLQSLNKGFQVDQSVPQANCYCTNREKTIPEIQKSLETKAFPPETCLGPAQMCISPEVTQHTSRDVTSSGCTLLSNASFLGYQQPPVDQNELLAENSSSKAEPSTNGPPTAKTTHYQLEPTAMAVGDQQASASDMATLLNEISMFLPNQHTVVDPRFSSPNCLQAYDSTAPEPGTKSLATAQSSSANCPPRPDPAWPRFSGGDSDTASLMSYNSVHGIGAQGTYNPYSFSPLSLAFSDNPSAALTPGSSRYSGRSSHSGKGSRNKRALSNSPLSADGIDLNAIIRMSPTSLVAYINGSRSSSSCVSPGSAGESYGHLSARNSGSSPASGSNSSGNRRSASFTPQASTPGNSRSRTDYFGADENLLVLQAMQELEAGGMGLPVSYVPTTSGLSNHFIPECENLQVLPQDIAALRTEDLLPLVPSVLPPVHTRLQGGPGAQEGHQGNPGRLQGAVAQQHAKPPPTYDQHMARKATLQKNSSSESSGGSSLPSNSSSFESSEGDKSTEGEATRMLACRWLDCAAVFQDQDEFVSHIEKVHVDQKKGDEFVCFWRLCPRRLHPFNARYKLLVHMRVHSGDKPNKCTYVGCKKAFSRLENLKIHLRSHTGEKPYTCTFPGCTKTFSNSSDRTKHQKTHQETKPYICQVAGCDKRYTDPSSLRKHVKKSHADKKEPDRKKIRGGAEEMDPKDLNECLMIQAIKPITLCDSSPPEPTDSGLGKSPRGSQLASSVDHYLGLTSVSDAFTRSETGQGSSSHTSPSSHNSNSPGQIDREKPPPNNNSLRVPILPPIVSSPIPQPGFPCRQQASSCLQLESLSPRNFSSLQGTRNHQDFSSRVSNGIYSPFNSPIYISPVNPSSKTIKHHTRGNS